MTRNSVQLSLRKHLTFVCRSRFLELRIFRLSLRSAPRDPGLNMPRNVLYYGDNLDMLVKYVRDETVDLVYLDPPFNSNQNYNVLFDEHDGTRAAAQLHAFEDTWEWDSRSQLAYETLVEGGHTRIAQTMRAFRTFLGESDVMAYLALMAPRLLELKRVLKDTGSLYLHCDPTVSHYLKLLLDAVFGPQRFINEVVWQRTSAHNDAQRYGRVHDILLFYSKSDARTWNPQHEPPDERYFKSHDFERDSKGRLYRKRDLTAPARGDSGQYEWKGKTPPGGRMWSYSLENMKRLEREGRIAYTRNGMPRLKLFVDELPGILYQDVWASPNLWLNSGAKERLGYQTQKPEALLERVIRCSTNEGDVVLDPFCGCGTAVSVAQRLKRRWIGIDITHLAIGIIRNRLTTAYGDTADFKVVGEPVSLHDARTLASYDRYQFQWWALWRAGARPTEQKKGADRGVDGRLFFHDDESGASKQIIFSVKSGHNVSVSDVRELSDVVRREGAQIGVLLTLEEPTRPMYREAVTAGFYRSAWGEHQRIQVITISELLDGIMVDYPAAARNITYKPAPRVKARPAEQVPIDFSTAATPAIASPGQPPSVRLKQSRVRVQGGLNEPNEVRLQPTRRDALPLAADGERKRKR
jgi:DNA modification methylase